MSSGINVCYRVGNIVQGKCFEWLYKTRLQASSCPVQAHLGIMDTTMITGVAGLFYLWPDRKCYCPAVNGRRRRMANCPGQHQEEEAYFRLVVVIKSNCLN